MFNDDDHHPLYNKQKSLQRKIKKKLFKITKYNKIINLL